MVDVGGYRLHLLSLGEDTGTPTVVLEAGTMAFSSYWAWVQPELAKFARVVAYDRAGLGWSDPGPTPRDAQRITTELHTALHNAGIEAPYVLVAHSQGGLYAPVFAGQKPDEVVGLVLVEPEHPDSFTQGEKAQAAKRSSEFVGRFGPILARLGLSRLMVRPLLTDLDGLLPQLPERQLAEVMAFFPTVKTVDANSGEVAAWDESTFPQVRNVASLGSIPIIVLSGGRSFGDAWVQAQGEYAALSTNSVHQVIDQATHGSLLTTREQSALVVDAVRQVIESARSGQPLSAK
jgi:pimeloyl-ACP methyl ester carboxylesterase